MRAAIDTNVIIDALADRVPFNTDAQNVQSLIMKMQFFLNLHRVTGLIIL